MFRPELSAAEHRTVPVWFVAAGVIALLGGGALLAVSGASMAEAKSGDTILTVTVAPSDPSGGTPDSGSGWGSGSGSGSGDGAVAGDETVLPDGGASPAPSASAAAPASESALFSVSSLTATHEWSANPIDTRVRLSLTVRNGSKSSVDSTVDFEVTSNFGNTVGSATGIAIDGLKPGKSRVVTVSIGNLGQWTLLNAHATVTPPKKLNGQALAPITREAFVVVPSTLLASGGGVVALGGASAAIWWLRRPIALLFGGV